MAVMPEDATMQHIVTQVMADYLAERKDLDLDGILYDSVQSEAVGHNVALFHRAARCEPIELPKVTKVRSHTSMPTEDGIEPDYWVWEEVPADVEESNKKAPEFLNVGTITLRVDAQSLASTRSRRSNSQRIITRSDGTERSVGETRSTTSEERRLRAQRGGGVDRCLSAVG